MRKLFRLRGVLCLCLLAISLMAGQASAQPADQAAVCASTLNCDWTTFQTMSMPDRLAFIRDLESGAASQLVPSFDRWEAIYGVTEFFRDQGLGALGSWVSIVNAIDLESMERGTALALGQPGGDYGNPGSNTWNDYLRQLQAGQLDTRSAHDAAWSRGEQAAIDYAQGVTQSQGAAPTPAERRFLNNSNLLRLAMRNEPAVLDLLQGITSVTDRELFFYWITDVRIDQPWRKSAALSYQLSRLDIPGTGIASAALLLTYLYYLTNGEIY